MNKRSVVITLLALIVVAAIAFFVVAGNVDRYRPRVQAELQDKLKNAGIKSYTQKIATGSGDRTRIRVGPFGSKEEAEKVRARLTRIGLSGTLVPA